MGNHTEACHRRLLLLLSERLSHERPSSLWLQLGADYGDGIRTKMMVADPIAANHVLLMFEMYAEPETSFGDITHYFEEQGIKIYGKLLTRPFLSQLLCNPIYAQVDLEMYEFFKSQGAVVVNDAADFVSTNGCYLYQGQNVKEDKDKSLKDQILMIAMNKYFAHSDIWLQCRKKLMTNITFQNGRKARNTWLAGKSNAENVGMLSKPPKILPAMNTSAVPSGLTTKAVRGAALSARMSLNNSFSQLWEKSSGISSYCGAARKKLTRSSQPIRWSLHRLKLRLKNCWTP